MGVSQRSPQRAEFQSGRCSLGQSERPESRRATMPRFLNLRASVPSENKGNEVEKFNEQLTNKQLSDIAISAACKALSAIEKIEQNAVASTPELNSGEVELWMVCLQMSKPRLICDRH